MEMGESEKALSQQDDDRNAFSELSEPSKAEHCIISDGGLVKFPEVRLVRQACGFGSWGASVGDGEKVFLEVGDAERDVVCDLINGPRTQILEDVHGVGSAGRSSSIVGDWHEPSSSVTVYLQRNPRYQEPTNKVCSSSNALAQPPHQVGYGENALGKGSDAVYEVGNGSNDVAPCSEISDFASPRLSFSRDFAMVDITTGVLSNTLCNNPQASSPRLSPEKRKWEQQDDNSSDFEFSHNEVEGMSNSSQEGCMLSAGELFHNGKLLPLAYPGNHRLYNDLYLPSTTLGHACDRQAVKMVPLCKADGSRPYIRQLSLELAMPYSLDASLQSSSTSGHSCDRQALEMPLCKADGSGPYIRHLNFELARPDSLPPPLQSPQTTCATVPAASPLHSLSFSPAFKYSLKFKEIFKPKNILADGLPDSELTRDNSFTSTCRFPISPRSFWPFFRNGFVCEKRTDVLSHAYRNILDRVASSSSKSSDSSDEASKSRNMSLQGQGYVDAINKNDSGSCMPKTEVEALNAEDTTKSSPHAATKLAFITANMSEDVREEVVQRPTFGLRDYGSPSNGCKNRGRVTRSFARGSPGRRGSSANKILLRNLERCSVERMVTRNGSRGLNMKSLYPTAFRVSPVLNVAVHKNGFFRFSSLFSSRKNKKPLEAAINWRKGA